MILFPAIDLYGRKAVRLYKGDYRNMTVYSDYPQQIAQDFKDAGATHIHMVDLEGARDGNTPNLGVISEIVRNTDLFVEVGGGIRSMDTVQRYLDAGVSRVILGTAAIRDPDLLAEAARSFPGAVAVGADVRDGFIAIHGWQDQTAVSLDAFLAMAVDMGIDNVICTDISRDGAMQGTNLALYRTLSRKYSLDLTASGGVSSLEDVRQLREMDLYGAIIGKAYYTGAIDLKIALEVAR